MNTLEIIDLHAKVGDKKILNGINLKIRSGEIHAIMGPNGSGKSTLCNVIMGHPKYKVTRGKILFDKKPINTFTTDKRALLGLFLGFQNPMEIPGVTLGNFLRLAKNSNLKASKNPQIGPVDFLNFIKKTAKELRTDNSFIGRFVNEGFSGGEKKRAEILQMAILEPKIAILDEIDSGLDIDALKIVAKGIEKTFKKTNPGILIITHYQRILNYLSPHFVHIMADGKIVKSGTHSLAKKLEKEGYEKFIN